MPLLYSDRESLLSIIAIAIATPLSGVGGAATHAVAGAVGLQLPLAPGHSAAINGVYTHSYFDVFYNNFHFVPERVDAGRVSSSVVFPVKLWNSHLVSKTITAVNVLGDTGVSTNLNPQTLGALADVSFDVSVSADGAGAIAARVAVSFGFVEAFLPVDGIRAVYFDIPLNWASAFNERIEFRTDTIRTFDGHEQRRALRSRPRLSLSMRFTQWPPEDLQRLLYTHQGSAVLIPHPRYTTRLAAAAAAGSTTLIVEPGAFWIQPNSLLSLETSADKVQLTVATVSGNTITLKSPLPFSMDVGDVVKLTLPVLSSRDVKTALPASNIYDATLAFTADETAIEWWPPRSFSEYLGRAVFDPPFDWRSKVILSSMSLIDVVDFNIGRAHTSTRLQQSFLEWKVMVKSMALPDVEWLQDFFRAMHGMARSFWWPGHHEEIQVVHAPRAGDSFIRVPGQDFFRDYRADPFRKHLLVRRLNGSTILRQVQDIITVNDSLGNDTHIVLSDVFTEDINDLQSVEWLYRARFGGDILSLKWETDNVFTATFGIRVLHVS